MRAKRIGNNLICWLCELKTFWYLLISFTGIITILSKLLPSRALTTLLYLAGAALTTAMVGSVAVLTSAVQALPKGTTQVLLGAVVDWMAPSIGATSHIQSAALSAGFWNMAAQAVKKAITTAVDPTGGLTAVSTAADLLTQINQ